AGVFPIDASKFDMVCIAGHKGMYGITSTGILICNTEDIDTIIEGGSGSLSYLFTAPEVLPDRLEAGTLNTVGILSLNAGIEFLKSKKNIEQYEKRLCNYLYESLNKYDNIQFYSPGNTILAFNINNKHSEEVTNFLNEKGFALRGGLQCSPLAHNHYGTSKQGVVRFSPSIFTKEIEVTSLIKNIRQIL
ncbi:MAG: aminotransferase class V-fold PLP-dependent enzyme, partial [Oscillospiraceae bacterium]